MRSGVSSVPLPRPRCTRRSGAGTDYIEPMPRNDDILRRETYKGDVDSTDLRVLYTLVADNLQRPLRAPSVMHDRLIALRTAKLLGLLVGHLEAKGLLDEAALDGMLLQAIS
jgi:hypothetical protein